MSTPSRRSELRRRRARQEKVSLLRKRYNAATAESDRNRILEKVKKVAPTITADQFTKAAGAGKAQ
ncbi:MAG TPA: DUF6800 family protein [Terriglobales bacterium]|nr:DUF6800 family protein [Terriglobales bacterium]